LWGLIGLLACVAVELVGGDATYQQAIQIDDVLEEAPLQRRLGLREVIVPQSLHNLLSGIVVELDELRESALRLCIKLGALGEL
jgi:hypothetical protein